MYGAFSSKSTRARSSIESMATGSAPRTRTPFPRKKNSLEGFSVHPGRGCGVTEAYPPIGVPWSLSTEPSVAKIHFSATRRGLSTNVSRPDTHSKNGFVSPGPVTCGPGVNVCRVWPKIASCIPSLRTGAEGDVLSRNSNSESESDSSSAGAECAGALARMTNCSFLR